MSPDRSRGGSFACRLVLVMAGLVAAAQVLGFLFPNGTLWGVDAYAFIGLPALALSALAVLGAAGYMEWSLARGRVGATSASSPDGEPTSPAIAPRTAHDFWLYPLLAVAGAALFAVFHASHVFLGDGVVLVTTLPLEKTFHPFEPLSLFLEQITYEAASPFLMRPDRETYEVAWIGAGGLSVLAGAVFAPVTWGIARHLARRIPPDGAPLGMRLSTALVFLVIVVQGYLQIFFGYVEVYALSATAIAIYLLTALRFLDDRRPLWPVAVSLAIAVALHLSAVVLAPSFAVLASVAATDPARRPRLVRDAVFAGAALAALPFALGLLGRGYHLGGTLISLISAVLSRQPEPIPGYFWSWRHLRDLLNEQLLIGPLALATFVPAAIVAIRRRTAAPIELAFFTVLGAGFGFVCLIAGDSNLGYARNWDLQAPAGFALAVCGTALLLPTFAGPVAARACLVLAIAVSCFHTIPWLAVNASSTRALRRFTTLPLELGRVESTVGYWYTLQGEPEAAERWFFRALDHNPGNVRAHLSLGDLYSQRGDYDRAARAYRAAIALSPESDEYRLRLIGALVRGGAPSSALGEAQRLVRRQPKDPRIWTVYGIVLLGNTRPEAARMAFAAARRNAPYSLLYRIMVNYVDLPHGFERAVDEVWTVLIGA
jgi:hypothetical protein